MKTNVIKESAMREGAIKKQEPGFSEANVKNSAGSTPNHIVILDPVSFAGGSKVATRHMISQLDPKETRITVLTADLGSWECNSTTSKAPRKTVAMKMPGSLASAEQGLRYFARHLVIAIQLLWLRILNGKIDAALAASGPGVDLALYLCKPVLGFRLVQIIHGPVAKSRTIGRCLVAADDIYYLESTRDSLKTALGTLSKALLIKNGKFKTFQNGLPKDIWPTPCQSNYPVVFWAASTLRWKGLDTLTKALASIHPAKRPEAHICYIKPKNSSLPVSTAPQLLSRTFWHHSPSSLDAIRANANVFVSTSTREPFGLSILEALAAGQCVLIPDDGAFWDKQLTDGVNCIKYPAGDAKALSLAIYKTCSRMDKVRAIGHAGKQVAECYRAEHNFASICESLMKDRYPSKAPSLVKSEVQ